MPHTPSDAADICVYFKRNKCKHGLSGKAPVGRNKECEAIHPQLCWQFLRYGPGKLGCLSGAKCGHLHPFICQQLWRTGSCDKGDRCGDGYHLGGRIGKLRFGSNYGVPNGTIEGPRTLMDRNYGGKHSRKASGNVTGIVL